jgi:hypothetical protein
MVSEIEEDAIAHSPSCSVEVSNEVVDVDVLRIVAFTIKQARTVREISVTMSIPLVKTYSLVDWMEEKGLLVEVGKVRTALHGKATRYISTISSGTIELQNNRLIVKCNHKDGTSIILNSDFAKTDNKE